MEACTLRFLFRNVVSLSFSLQRLRNFSSSSYSSSSAAASLKTRKFFSDDSTEGRSSVYQHALKFQRPTTIRWRAQLHNSVSFIGTVDRPLQQVNCKTNRLGAYTMLNVKTSHNSNRFFKILLKMWDEMAEISFKHLKPNDFVYVSGHLQSYTKVDNIGKPRTYYEVLVKEFNHVVQLGQGQTYKKSVQADSEGSGETGIEKCRNRLRLWQVFFVNPCEWRDYRRTKVNPNHPDFKHKDTGEALWINANDPPWIKRQLQLHDSRLSARGDREDTNSHSSLSWWVYDD